MKAIFRILGTAAAVAATGAAIVIMDKLLNEKAAPIIESIEFPEEAEKDDAEAAKTAEAYAEGEARAEAEAAAPAEETAPAEEPAAPETEAAPAEAAEPVLSLIHIWCSPAQRASHAAGPASRQGRSLRTLSAGAMPGWRAGRDGPPSTARPRGSAA